MRQILSASSVLCALAAFGLNAADLSAQSTPPNFLDEFTGQFEASARKFVALAEAMPAEKYGWQPGDDVMSVVHVYMHIARYNYMYLDQNLGYAPGEGAAYNNWETGVTRKDEAVAILSESMDHVRSYVADLTADDLEQTTRLYGRDVANWAVLLQLVTHMNEHLGQSIAYARMNGVVPPWSR